MSKYFFTVISLVLLATAIGPAAAQDDAICEALKAIHTKYADSLAAYLSDKGRDCLEPAATPVPTATPNGPIWSVKGAGTQQRSLSLDLTRGLYELNAPVPIANRQGNWAQLSNIISAPDSCLKLQFLSFPGMLRITRNCTIHATLKVEATNYSDRNKRWEYTITKASDTLPPVPKANGWSVHGVGFSNLQIELIFEPGIYVITKQRGPDVTSLGTPIGESRSCLGVQSHRLPTQFKVSKRCHFKGGLQVGYSHGAVGSWSYSIEKVG